MNKEFKGHLEKSEGIVKSWPAWKKGEVKKFPILQDGKKVYVNWSFLNEDWAQEIHGQTLERLAERGGMSKKEIFLNVKRMDSGGIYSITDDLANELVSQILADNS